MLASLSTIVSCSGSDKSGETEEKTPKYSQLEKARLLIGTWENNFPEGCSTEMWEMQNDSTYTGKSWVVIGGDTVSYESLTLQQSGEELYYIPTVKDQNNNQGVKFKLTSTTDKLLVFENPKHDFPQKISYTFVTKDSVLAEISGTMDGKPSSQQFPMARAK